MPKRKYKVTVCLTVDERQDGAPTTTNGVAWNVEAALKDERTKRMFALETTEVTEVSAALSDE